jgi:hypothetical protein
VACTVEQDDMAAKDWRRLAARSELANEARGGALDAGDHKLCQFGRHLRPIAKCHDVVVVVIQAGCLPIPTPEFIRKSGSRAASHDVLSFRSIGER